MPVVTEREPSGSRRSARSKSNRSEPSWSGRRRNELRGSSRRWWRGSASYVSRRPQQTQQSTSTSRSHCAEPVRRWVQTDIYFKLQPSLVYTIPKVIVIVRFHRLLGRIQWIAASNSYPAPTLLLPHSRLLTTLNTLYYVPHPHRCWSAQAMLAFHFS